MFRRYSGGGAWRLRGNPLVRKLWTLWITRMSEKAVCKVPGRSALTEIKYARKRMGRNCFLDVEWTKLFVGWPVAKMIVQAVCQNIGGQNQIRVFCGWLYDAV